MDTPRKPVVIDTNILLYAISNGAQEGPDNNSELDRNTRNMGISPQQVRGALILLLIESPAIIPDVVVQELLSKRLGAMMSEKNTRNLKLVLEAVKGRTTPLIPQRIELIRQNVGVRKIQEKAEAAAEAIRKTGIDIPNDWADRLLEDRAGAFPAIQTLRNNQACLTWAKIHGEAGKIRKTITDLPPTGETTQRNFLKIAEEIAERLDRPEVSKEEMETLAPQQAQAEMDADAAKPYLLPDAEILFIARQHNACIYTLDNDIDLLRTEFPGDPGQPTISRTSGPWKSIEELVRALKENLRRPPKIAPKIAPDDPQI